MNPQKPTILLVEDDENDVFLMQFAMQKAKIHFPVTVVTHGQEALDYLNGVEKFADRAAYPIPAIIFLDLKLPYIQGFEVLRWIRQESSFQQLNVHILTASDESRDLQKAADLGANGYLVKPPTPEMLLPILHPLLSTSAS